MWISGNALEELTSVDVKLAHKLREYAKAGFENYTTRSGPIRHEWDGVYRIGLHSSLFRLYGFFERPNSFVIIDSSKKRGQKLSAGERARIDNVAKVKQRASWKKRIER